MAGTHLRFDIELDRFLDNLTAAACAAAVKRGFCGSKKSLRASTARALKKVIKTDMQACERCGSHIIGVCCHAQRFTPWSQEAKKLGSAT